MKITSTLKLVFEILKKCKSHEKLIACLNLKYKMYLAPDYYILNINFAARLWEPCWNHHPIKTLQSCQSSTFLCKLVSTA